MLLVLDNQAAVHPPAKKLCELVKQGYIGEVQAVRDKGYYGGFGIVHQGCHALALAVSVMGQPRAVSAHMTSGGGPTNVDDIYQAPFGYRLTAGENLTCMYELPNGAYFIVNDLLTALEVGREPLSSARDAMAALEMIMAVYESHVAGDRVPLPLSERTHPLSTWKVK